jgi:hypothetical protein
MSQLLRENAITKLAMITGLDAKTVATTEIFVVPTGKSMVVTKVVIRVTAFTVGSKSVQAIASFGGNSVTYDDYLNSVTYTVSAVSKVIQDELLDAEVPLYAAATSFRISIETGSNATTETWAVDLFGYLV